MMRLKVGVGVLAIGLVCSTSVRAGLYDTDTDRTIHINRVAGYHASSFGGGEFTIKDLTNFTAVTGTISDSALSALDDYQTFCVEYNEYFQPSDDILYFVDVTDYATRGGAGGYDGNQGPNNVSSDSLDERTAYLYQNFRYGTLALYDYDPDVDRDVDSKDLQEAIWFLEGERNWDGTKGIGSGAEYYVQLAVNATGITSTATTGTKAGGFIAVGEVTWGTVGVRDLGDVRILNLWGDGSRHTPQFKQDQLIMIPAPGAALLAMLGLGLVRGLKRRQAA